MRKERITFDILGDAKIGHLNAPGGLLAGDENILDKYQFLLSSSIILKGWENDTPEALDPYE